MRKTLIGKHTGQFNSCTHGNNETTPNKYVSLNCILLSRHALQQCTAEHPDHAGSSFIHT